MKSVSLFFGSLNFTKWALLTLTPVLTVILNIQSALAGLAIIIFIDMLTGMNKSLHKEGVKVNFFKLEFWKSIHSSGMRETWRKTYEYGIGIIVFAVFESMVFKSIEGIQVAGYVFSITELAVITASVVEVYSVFENMEAVTGRNLLKRIVRFLKDNQLIGFLSRILKKGG
jgi:hypothetical protein